VSNKSKSTTFLLCYFFGVFGVHRFYLGKPITGLLMLLTGGGLAIWWLVDLYRIGAGRLKDKQGDDLSRSSPHADQPNAGFWVRVSALIVDSIILGLIQIVFVMAPVMAYLYNMGIATAPDPQAAIMAVAPILALAQVAILILYVGYYVALTAGKHQGTYGKRSMGIYVRKRDGGRVWIGHSLVRVVGYIISYIPLGLGFLMAAFNKRKLALHDLIAGTEVVYGVPSDLAATVDRDAVTEVAQPEEAPTPVGLPVGLPAGLPAGLPMESDDVRPSRVPEIMVGTGLLLIAGTMAIAYLR